MNNVHANVNDNHLTHRLYQGKSDHLPYVPAAHYLIERYVSDYWKHDRNDLDFIDMELSLCAYLEEADKREKPCPISRGLSVKWIARMLKVSPLILYNDPGLPF